MHNIKHKGKSVSPHLVRIIDDDFYYLACSECNHTELKYSFDYCPYCGVKFDKAIDDTKIIYGNIGVDTKYV